jgi:hypothetical protein
MFQEKTINLLLALVTGRSWCGQTEGRIDFWDCPFWINFIKIHITDYLVTSPEIILINLKSGYFDISQEFLMRKIHPKIRPMTNEEKKKAGLFDPNIGRTKG